MTYAKTVQHFPMNIKIEVKVEENPSHCVIFFSMETGKLNILKDHLLPPRFVSRFSTFSWALFGLCSMKSKHMFLLLFWPSYLHCFIFL